MNVGYHYTSWGNWLRIRREGMVPQRVAPDKYDAIMATYRELGEDPGWDGRGIWIWKHRMSGGSHAGSVLFQVGTKGDPRVVLLRVRYGDREYLRMKKDDLKIGLRHRGRLGKWNYHTGDDAEMAVMVHVPLNRRRIELVAEFDVTRQFRYRYSRAAQEPVARPSGDRRIGSPAGVWALP